MYVYVFLVHYFLLCLPEKSEKVVKFISGLIVSVDLLATIENMVSCESIRVQVINGLFRSAKFKFLHCNRLTCFKLRAGNLPGPSHALDCTTQQRIQAIVWQSDSSQYKSSSLSYSVVRLVPFDSSLTLPCNNHFRFTGSHFGRVFG